MNAVMARRTWPIHSLPGVYDTIWRASANAAANKLSAAGLLPPQGQPRIRLVSYGMPRRCA